MAFVLVDGLPVSPVDGGATSAVLIVLLPCRTRKGLALALQRLVCAKNPPVPDLCF